MFRIARIALLAASLCSVATAQTAEGCAPAPNSPQPRPVDKPLPFVGLAHLELSANEDGLRAFVHGAEPGFLGVVVLSLTPDLTHFLTGLPPILTDSVVVAFGVTKSQDLELRVPIQAPQQATKVYGQAIILDEHGLWASGIVPIVVAPKDPATLAPATL